jgi:hypothetical protein
MSKEGGPNKKSKFKSYLEKKKIRKFPTPLELYGAEKKKDDLLLT